jgi:hypothetical protein
VRYRLKWVGFYLALALVLFVATRIWLGDRWVGLDATVAAIITWGARKLYERAADRHAADHD